MRGARINASVGEGRLQSTRAAAATDKRDADDFIVELCCLWLYVFKFVFVAGCGASDC